MRRWNHLATIALVKDYNGFDLEKDFPAVYRWVFSLKSELTMLNMCTPQLAQRNAGAPGGEEGLRDVEGYSMNVRSSFHYDGCPSAH